MSIVTYVNRKFFPALIVNTNTFTWYSLVYAILPRLIENLQISDNNKFLIITLSFLGIASGAFLGATLSKFLSRFPFQFWIVTTSTLTLLMIFISAFQPLYIALYVLLFGLLTGFGFPSCLALFASTTDIEDRGKHSGIVWGITGMCTLLMASISSKLDINSQVIAYAIWRELGLFYSVFQVEMETSRQTLPYLVILKDKNTVFYFLPWILFCIVNWVEAPIVENLFGREIFFSMFFFQLSLIGVFAVLGGLLSDIIGRKRVIMASFILLGFEYALLGLFSGFLIVRYLFIIIDSISWGIFTAVLFTIIWGDLSERGGRERYYFFGGLPYLTANYLSTIIKPFVAIIRVDAAFSLASFFLFLAIIPLMYAPETLPEKLLRERELKGYIEKAKRLREKFTKG